MVILTASFGAACVSSLARKPANVLEIPFDYAVKDEVIPRNPVVQATIQGRRILLVLDTGATGHVLNKELSESLGLKRAQSDAVGHDHFGNNVDIGELLPVQIELGSWKMEAAPIFAIPRPKPLLKRGIFGTLSPQKILASGVVVLDQPSKKLLILQPAPANINEWLAARFSGYDFVEMERPGNSQEMLVQASLPGRAEVSVLLDTGSAMTEFSEVYTKLAPDVYRSSTTLSIGGHNLRLNRMEVRSFDNQDYMAGILGLDAIRNLVLAFPAGSSKVLLGFPRQ